MKYFNGCTTTEEARKLYLKLAKENHPDMGGELETMKAINVEYDFFCAKVMSGETLTNEETESRRAYDEGYRQVIEQIIVIPGIIIEIVGTWIWVTGATFPVRAQLYAAKLTYAGGKKAWHWHPDEERTFWGGGKSLDEIRAKYGSETISKNYKGKKKLHKTH